MRIKRNRKYNAVYRTETSLLEKSKVMSVKTRRIEIGFYLNGFCLTIRGQRNMQFLIVSSPVWPAAYILDFPRSKRTLVSGNPTGTGVSTSLEARTEVEERFPCWKSFESHRGFEPMQRSFLSPLCIWYKRYLSYANLILR